MEKLCDGGKIMPSCRPDVISEIMYLVMGMKPQTILDVGAGYGKWGVLCTEYLKYWCGIEPEIDGVEVFKGYTSPAYGAYRSVLNVDVMSLLKSFRNYDLVLAVDVIEHLTRQDGIKMLSSVDNHYIVSTPNYWLPQGADFGNKHERHVSQWSREDFANSILINDKVGRQHVVGWK